MFLYKTGYDLPVGRIQAQNPSEIQDATIVNPASSPLRGPPTLSTVELVQSKSPSFQQNFLNCLKVAPIVVGYSLFTRPFQLITHTEDDSESKMPVEATTKHLLVFTHTAPDCT